MHLEAFRCEANMREIHLKYRASLCSLSRCALQSSVCHDYVTRHLNGMKRFSEICPGVRFEESSSVRAGQKPLFPVRACTRYPAIRACRTRYSVLG